ncbi:hypothetical protein [Bradyrhizobium jicamae]|uniref:hypothetical protein n=1 Tax=Bradyrhizobium jicamae TaxID=280332 RepID=UPI0012EEC539|nr:hypothetical protein [Bradyrhizobium jicamae]
MNAIEPERKRSKLNEADRYPLAHNGLVAGSSPAGPTSGSMLGCISFRSPLATAPEMPASLRRVVLQQIASYFSGFDTTTIFPTQT